MEAAKHVTAQQNNETLFGGRTVLVIKEDGSNEEVKVRQLPLREYDAGFRVFDSELELCALVCSRTKPWVESVLPDSYEALWEAVQEVNARGFFAYAERRNARFLQRLNSMSPQTLKAAAEASSISSTSPPQRLRPVAG